MIDHQGVGVQTKPLDRPDPGRIHTQTECMIHGRRPRIIILLRENRMMGFLSLSPVSSPEDQLKAVSRSQIYGLTPPSNLQESHKTVAIDQSVREPDFS